MTKQPGGRRVKITNQNENNLLGSPYPIPDALTAFDRRKDTSAVEIATSVPGVDFDRRLKGELPLVHGDLC